MILHYLLFLLLISRVAIVYRELPYLCANIVVCVCVCACVRACVCVCVCACLCVLYVAPSIVPGPQAFKVII